MTFHQANNICQFHQYHFHKTLQYKCYYRQILITPFHASSLQHIHPRIELRPAISQSLSPPTYQISNHRHTKHHSHGYTSLIPRLNPLPTRLHSNHYLRGLAFHGHGPYLAIIVLHILSHPATSKCQSHLSSHLTIPLHK